MKSFGIVETHTKIKGEIRKETRHYLGSLPLSGGIGQTGQKPLGGGNQCHWVLDVIYREDESRA